jgi:hypothetical protein
MKLLSQMRRTSPVQGLVLHTDLAKKVRLYNAEIARNFFFKVL